MRMDQKIRQAFRRATPNVLSSLPQEHAAPAKKKKQIRTRVLEFAATAAALALLVGMVGGTVQYVRSQYGSGDTGPLHGTTTPSDTETNYFVVPVETYPGEILDRPTNTLPPADIDIIGDQEFADWLKTYVCELIYWADEVQTESLPEVTVTTEDGLLFLAQASHRGYEYVFSFDSVGELVDISIPLCDCIKDGYISLGVAEQIALLRARQLGSCVLWTSFLETAENNPPCWLVAVQSTDGLWAAEYRINARTGVLMNATEPEISVQAGPYAYNAIINQYREALTEQWSGQQLMDADMNYLIRDVAPKTVGYGLYDLDGDCVAELVIGTVSGDEYYGKMIFDLYKLDESGNAALVFRTTERNRYYHAGGARFANLGSSGADDSIETTLELDGLKWTDLGYVTDPAEYSQLGLDPFIADEEPSVYISAETVARDLALAQIGVSLDEVRCLKIGSESASEYMVYFEADGYAYTLYVDLISARFLYGQRTETAPSRYGELQDGILNWKSARDKCMAVYDSRIEDLIGMSYELYLDTPQAYSDVVDFYSFEMHFTDGSYSVWVDARTGEFIVSVPSGSDQADTLSLDAATNAALEYAGLSREEITDYFYKYDDRYDGSPRYWIYFAADGKNYEIAVHAYSGQILESSTWE